jgi:predicted amidohydrolase YtcJ
MFNTSRREFVLTLGAFALFPLERTEPELILYNGNFWTVDSRNPRAQAVAISANRFLAVGSNDDVLNLASGRSRKIDLGQKTVLPGFIDAHTHPAESGRLHLRQVDCDLRSIAAIQAALRERAAKTPPGLWVLGSAYSRDDYREGVKLIAKMMTRTGITSVGDALGSPDDLQAYQHARDNGDLLFRVYCFIHSRWIDRMIAAGVRTGFGDEWVRVGGMKQIADGAISGRTARLSQPYIGHPNDYGTFSATEEELYDYGRRAHAAGWQLGTHANGDAAIERVLSVYERINREMPRKDPRFRIEHCTVINDSIIQRMQALNVIPLPFSTYVYYHGEKMQYYGEERLKHMFALRTFLDAGLRPTQSSDYPPGEFPPMMALQSEVTRTDMNGHVWGANQRISVEEAIYIGTVLMPRMKRI